MSKMQTQLPTDTWVKATWDEYLQVIENPAFAKAKGYYHNGQMRVEMPPVGNDHASDHAIVIVAIGLFVVAKNLRISCKDNCTYRKTGFSDVQPDVSYYIGKNATTVPYGTSIIHLDIYSPPDLVIEVANSSLADDKGEKRLMYEDLGIAEYWIIDVQNAQVIAFAIENGGSRRITESQVLPGLAMSVLNEALRRTRKIDQGQVYTWLLSQFQQ